MIIEGIDINLMYNMSYKTLSNYSHYPIKYKKEQIKNDENN